MSNSTKNVQYRFVDEGVLVTDLLTNNYVKISHDLFNEIKTEHMHRLDDKKYKNKKVEMELVNKEDIPRMNRIMAKVVHEELLPSMIHILNENMTKHKVSMSLPLMGAILGNLINDMSYHLLRVYPITVQTTVAQMLSMDIIRIVINMPDYIDRVNSPTMSKEERIKQIESHFRNDSKQAISEMDTRFKNFSKDILDNINELGINSSGDYEYKPDDVEPKKRNNSYDGGTFKE